MAQHGGKRSGAGRPKGSKNKTTIAREAVAEVLGVDPSETLDAAIHQRGYTLLSEMERIALDPTQPIGARILAARTALPFLLPRKNDPQGGPVFPDELVAKMQERRNRVHQLRDQLVSHDSVSLPRAEGV